MVHNYDHHFSATLFSSKSSSWLNFMLPACFIDLHNVNLLNFLLILIVMAALSWALSPGGSAWKNGRAKMGRVPIPGPRGLPFIGNLLALTNTGSPHRILAHMASTLAATRLMAFTIGSTPAVVTSDPAIAREILFSPHFATRPIKLSAKLLMFSRAIGFTPAGTYWRFLRRTSSAHLFSHRRIASHESGRQLSCIRLLDAIATDQQQSRWGVVGLREHLQTAALDNIMRMVFGKRKYEVTAELKEMVREGFEILGAFNWCDHLPWLGKFYDPLSIRKRCSVLVPRVRRFVSQIIQDHRVTQKATQTLDHHDADFVDVLLSLQGEEKLDDDDMVAILWEMVFRGTDTIALLTEWVMAELTLKPELQEKLHRELANTGDDTKTSSDADVAQSPLLNAIIKETLRLHPPGPLLSWARLSTADVQLSNGMVIPASTTAMVNMWAITHDPAIWPDPHVFKPEIRFMKSHGGGDVDVRGQDLRLAPFGAGRRVCPGKDLGLVTVKLWVARLVQRFKWVEDAADPVDMIEVLKLSSEMKKPLRALAIPRKTTSYVSSTN